MSTLDRTRPPESGPIRDFDVPRVDRLALANGLDLRVAHMNRLPVVSVNLFIRSGEDALTDDNAGLSVLTADALEGGTKRRSGSEMAEALEGIGARVSASGGWEGTSVGLSCLADRLPEALGILAESLLEPAFPDDEVDRAREQQLAGIRQREMDPASLASDSAPPHYFAAGVPYARPLAGTTASISAMSRDDLRGYADANYRPGLGGLVVAGDVETTEVEQMVEDHFGAWAGSPASVADFEVEPATRRRSVHIVNRPGAVQSEIRVGHVGVARSIPDYYPLSIANMVLGGMFTSRLNLNLREENGFTYGIRSGFVSRTRPGPFQVSTSVGSDVTAPAIREIMAELVAMAESGPTEEEVAAARDYAAGVFGLQFETVGQVASRVTQLIIYGLPETYFQEYRDTIRGVTRDEVAEAASCHIRPEEVQIVVVGDADVIGSEIEELGLGVVEVVDVGS